MPLNVPPPGNRPPTGPSAAVSGPSPTTPPVADPATTGTAGETPPASVTNRLSDSVDVLGGDRRATPGSPSDSPACGEAIKTFFAPYDDTRKVEVDLIDEVIAARRADPKPYPPDANPYTINYAVYNLSSDAVINKLVEAERAGVDVQVLIESHQLDPKKSWNEVDEKLTAAGFTFEADHTVLSPEERKRIDLIGIENDRTLMHLKSRIYSYPDPETGELKQKLLTGSMNPGESAVRNDENLNLITDERIVKQYIKMYESVRDGREMVNEFDSTQPINAMFTPAKGPRVTDQIFKWIDQEDEAIFLSVFSLRNLTTPTERTSLVKKLKAAQDRGVKVVVITDQKQSDGIDINGNKVYWDDRTDDLLRDAGIPVYEAMNRDAGPFNAMHAKCAVFGLTDMKVITDTGNWTKAALGSWRNDRPQNEESYLFVDSGKLDNNATGMRYLGNWLNILRKYDHQTPTEKPAEKLIAELTSDPRWPKVEVDFSVVAHTFMGQDVYITGDHPSLGNWLQDGPGMKLNTAPGRYPTWESGGSLKLPFGSKFEFKVVKKGPDGSIEWQPGRNGVLIVDPMDGRFNADVNGDAGGMTSSGSY